MKTSLFAVLFFIASVSHAKQIQVIEAKAVTCAQANELLSQDGQLKVKYKNIFGFTSTTTVTTDPQCPFTTIPESAYFRTQDKKNCRLGFYTTCQPDPVYNDGGN